MDLEDLMYGGCLDSVFKAKTLLFVFEDGFGKVDMAYLHELLGLLIFHFIKFCLCMCCKNSIHCLKFDWFISFRSSL